MRIPFINLRSLALFSALVSAPAFSEEENTWDKELDNTVSIRILNTSNDELELYTMLDFVAGELICKHPDAQSANEWVTYPIAVFEQNNLSLQLRPSQRLQSALDMIRSDETVDGGVEILRPIIWPLVKAIDIPETFSDFHRYINLYVDALLRLELIDEAEAMIDYFDFNKINAQKTELVLQLVRIYLQQGRADDGARYLGKLPLDGSQNDLQVIAKDFGKKLRESGRYIEATSVYERRYTLEDSEFQQESLLWTAYCFVKAGRLDSAQIYLSLADDFEPRQIEFSLKRLIEGLIFLESGQSQNAMSSVSQGIVFSRLGLDWISELMLLAGKSYEAVGRPEVAANVYRELIQFYPTDQFADEARNLLAALPEEARNPPAPPKPESDEESGTEET